MSLQRIQLKLKVPKSQLNKFGNFKYRSCEDILEALKPLLAEQEYALIVTDEVLEIGGRVYIKATARLTSKDNKPIGEAVGYAREPDTQKGMNESMITGAASSYARKYAINGLFAIDDSKDADATHDGNGKTDLPKTLTPFEKGSSNNQIEDLQKLMRAVGYDRSSLKKTLDKFSSKERKQFYDTLTKQLPKQNPLETKPKEPKPEKEIMVVCPALGDGETRTGKYCNTTCKMRKDCPAWGDGKKEEKTTSILED